MEKKSLEKSISFKTKNAELARFLEEVAETRRLSQNGLIEIALQFLMEWPEEELDQIIGKSASRERLRALVEEYVATSRGAGDPR